MLYKFYWSCSMEMVKNIHINTGYLLVLGITPSGLGSLKAVTEIRILYFKIATLHLWNCILKIFCFIVLLCVHLLSIEKDEKVNILGHVRDTSHANQCCSKCGVQSGPVRELFSVWQFKHRNLLTLDSGTRIEILG